MTLAKTYKNTLVSILIITLLTVFVFMAAKPYAAPIDNWWLVVFCMLILFISIATGIICIVLRLIKILKDTNRFFYNFTGILNLYFGIIGLSSFIVMQSKMLDSTWIGIFTTDLLLGLIIIADVYKRKGKSSSMTM